MAHYFFVNFYMPSLRSLYFSFALSANTFWLFYMSLQLYCSLAEALEIYLMVWSLFLFKKLDIRE